MKHYHILLWVGLFLITIFGCLRFRSTAMPNPGVIKSNQNLLVWTSPETDNGTLNQSQVESKFDLINTGGLPVRVLSVESGCGCTKVRVEPEIIKPGDKAAVFVTATPFPVGEKQVFIKLNTDSPITPEVRLKLQMIGSSKPPFLINVSGDLSYPNPDSTARPREIEINTVESAGKTKIPEPIDRRGILEFKRVSVLEKPYATADAVQRTYRYRVVFKPGMSAGTISGDVRVDDPWKSGRVEILPFLVKNDPPIRVVPSPIILNITGDNVREITSEFLVLTKNNNSEEVLELDATIKEKLEIERIGPRVGGPVSRYRIRLIRASDDSVGDHQFVVRASSNQRSETQIVTVSVRRSQ